MARRPTPEEFSAIKKEAQELSEAMGIEVRTAPNGQPMFKREVLDLVFKSYGFSKEGTN